MKLIVYIKGHLKKKFMFFLTPFKKAPFPVTVRWSKGQDIDAGCGQLATNIK